MLEQQIEYTDHAIALLESIKLKSKAGAPGAAIHEELPGDSKMIACTYHNIVDTVQIEPCLLY